MDPVLPLLEELILMDTTSLRNGQVDAIRFISGWLADCSVRCVDADLTADHPYALFSVRGGEQRVLEGGDQRATSARGGDQPTRESGDQSALEGDDQPARKDGGILFVCHIDTVPAQPADWRGGNPFEFRVADGRAYGRGSSDMKSGLAATMVALAAAAAEGHNVHLLVTSDEEVGCLGAFSACECVAALQPSAVIVPESTNMRVRLGNRGATWLRVTTQGVAAHGSTPEQGESAIKHMAELILDLPHAPLREHPDLGTETINVGTISGGSAPNIVPDRCEVVCDVRTVGADADHVVSWLASHDGVSSVERQLELPALWTDPDDPFVSRVLELASAPGVGPVSYFCDAGVLQRVTSGCPIVIWGPGDPNEVHRADESVEIASVEAAVVAYAAIMRGEYAAG